MKKQFKLIVVGKPGFVKEIQSLKKGEVSICEHTSRNDFDGSEYKEYAVDIALGGRCCTTFTLPQALLIAGLVEKNKKEFIKIHKELKFAVEGY